MRWLFALLCWCSALGVARADGPPVEGLPDYVGWLNERIGADVAAEDNAFVALLPLLRPADQEAYEPAWLAGVETVLGVDVDPDAGPAIVWVTEWPGVCETFPDEEAQNALEERLTDGPWSPADEPAAAAWLTSQAEGFAALEAAIARPAYFAPLVRERMSDSMASVLLPHLGDARRQARLLWIRANRDLAMGDTEGVLRNLVTMRALADHLRHEPILISNLVGASIDSITAHVAGDLVRGQPLTTEQATRLAWAMPAEIDGFRIADNVDLGERSFMLDAIDWMARRERDPDASPDASAQLDFGEPDMAVLLRVTAGPGFDRPRAKARSNALFDRWVEAMREPAYAEAAEAVAAVEAELEAISPPAWLTALLAVGTVGELAADAPEMPAREALTDAVTDQLLAQFAPSMNAAFRTERARDMKFMLARLTAALEHTRAKQGQYPATLAALHETLDQPPFGPVTTELFAYRLDDDGRGYRLETLGLGEPGDTEPERLERFELLFELRRQD
ncbi:MAG: hypothetical protein AAF328_11810 [Planctomycetota bacterium]